MTSSLKYLAFAACCLDNLDFRYVTFFLRYLTFVACCLGSLTFRFVTFSLGCLTFVVCYLDSLVFRSMTSSLMYMTFVVRYLLSGQSLLESNHQDINWSRNLFDNLFIIIIKDKNHNGNHGSGQFSSLIRLKNYFSLSLII